MKQSWCVGRKNIVKSSPNDTGWCVLLVLFPFVVHPISFVSKETIITSAMQRCCLFCFFALFSPPLYTTEFYTKKKKRRKLKTKPKSCCDECRGARKKMEKDALCQRHWTSLSRRWQERVDWRAPRSSVSSLEEFFVQRFTRQHTDNVSRPSRCLYRVEFITHKNTQILKTIGRPRRRARFKWVTTYRKRTL